MDGAANPERPMIYQSPVSQACKGGGETMVGVSDKVKQAQARTPP